MGDVDGVVVMREVDVEGECVCAVVIVVADVVAVVPGGKVETLSV